MSDDLGPVGFVADRWQGVSNLDAFDGKEAIQSAAYMDSCAENVQPQVLQQGIDTLLT